jgi:CPW-WPC domain-containing protein
VAHCTTLESFAIEIMQRVFCFASSVVIACCAVAHDTEASTGAPSHPVLNIHLTESNDAAALHGLADGQSNSEQFLGALEKRAFLAESLLENQMSMVNAQIHELVNLGSSLAAVSGSGGMMLQLRGRGRERHAVGVSSDLYAQHDVQTLKEELALVAQDAHSSDKDTQPGAESAGDGFDAPGAEAVARQRLMKAQKNFASVGNVVESEDQKAIDSKLASAMETPSRSGTPVSVVAPANVADPCQLDVHSCPQGWKDAAGTCVAGTDYAGPCAGELVLSGMSEEQLLAIAKHCRLELSCQ